MSFLRCISVQRLAATHVMRVAPSAVHILRGYRFQRFSSTPHPRAAPQDISAFTSAFRNTALYKEISNKPAVLEAIKDLMAVLQEQGISMDPRNPPSATKLLTNPKVWSQIRHTMSVLKENGVSADNLKDAYKAIQPEAVEKKEDS
ncbi:hypothetical protein K474DRAFT_1705386 [Panus rudis PR-1116 ss-1]|nr:hypothetical protein K474DRAFT_1705386 [Panus rudis PR-1116 ss-1]